MVFEDGTVLQNVYKMILSPISAFIIVLCGLYADGIWSSYATGLYQLVLSPTWTLMGTDTRETFYSVTIWNFLKVLFPRIKVSPLKAPMLTLCPASSSIREGKENENREDVSKCINNNKISIGLSATEIT